MATGLFCVFGVPRNRRLWRAQTGRGSRQATGHLQEIMVHGCSCWLFSSIIRRHRRCERASAVSIGALV